MRKRRYILYWILISCVFSCDIPRKKLTFNHKEKESMNNDSTILKNLELKNYFAPYGNDSLLMIPDWVLGNLYESPLEPYHKLYKRYQEFKDDFLYNPKNLPVRLKWSYHFGINKQIMEDYSYMTFEHFTKKYTLIEGNDTLLIINDTTLAFCFDKKGYYCIFNYGNTGKSKITR